MKMTDFARLTREANKVSPEGMRETARRLNEAADAFRKIPSSEWGRNMRRLTLALMRDDRA